mmetsp:Transcript_16326/g.27607  ORF Transcript_16326/g.27607 Transcript_16326/m.27607 type:complete len:81 (+) Transcript_16326:2885-3127(+)
MASEEKKEEEKVDECNEEHHSFSSASSPKSHSQNDDQDSLMFQSMFLDRKEGEEEEKDPVGEKDGEKTADQPEAAGNSAK